MDSTPLRDVLPTLQVSSPLSAHHAPPPSHQQTASVPPQQVVTLSGPEDFPPPIQLPRRRRRTKYPPLVNPCMGSLFSSETPLLGTRSRRSSRSSISRGPNKDHLRSHRAFLDRFRRVDYGSRRFHYRSLQLSSVHRDCPDWTVPRNEVIDHLLEQIGILGDEEEMKSILRLALDRVVGWWDKKTSNREFQGDGEDVEEEENYWLFNDNLTSKDTVRILGERSGLDPDDEATISSFTSQVEIRPKALWQLKESATGLSQIFPAYGRFPAIASTSRIDPRLNECEPGPWYDKSTRDVSLVTDYRLNCEKPVQDSEDKYRRLFGVWRRMWIGIPDSDPDPTVDPNFDSNLHWHHRDLLFRGTGSKLFILTEFFVSCFLSFFNRIDRLRNIEDVSELDPSRLHLNHSFRFLVISGYVETITSEDILDRILTFVPPSRRSRISPHERRNVSFRLNRKVESIVRFFSSTDTDVRLYVLFHNIGNFMNAHVQRIFALLRSSGLHIVYDERTSEPRVLHPSQGLRIHWVASCEDYAFLPLAGGESRWCGASFSIHTFRLPLEEFRANGQLFEPDLIDKRIQAIVKRINRLKPKTRSVICGIILISYLSRVKSSVFYPETVRSTSSEGRKTRRRRVQPGLVSLQVLQEYFRGIKMGHVRSMVRDLRRSLSIVRETFVKVKLATVVLMKFAFSEYVIARAPAALVMKIPTLEGLYRTEEPIDEEEAEADGETPVSDQMDVDD